MGNISVRMEAEEWTPSQRRDLENLAFEVQRILSGGLYPAETNVTKLTDSTGGSTDGTLSSTSDTVADDNFAEINEKLNAIIDALTNLGLMEK